MLSVQPKADQEPTPLSVPTLAFKMPRKSSAVGPPVCLKLNGSNIDKDLSSAAIVVPIASMAAMLNERMMPMLVVEPTFVVVLISQSAT